MAVDFQVVFPQESIVLNDIRVVQYGGLWAVRVEGEDFRSVDSVSINELESPDVIVLSKTCLLYTSPSPRD